MNIQTKHQTRKQRKQRIAKRGARRTHKQLIAIRLLLAGADPHFTQSQET
jgi:hypothetical protein